MRIAIFFLSFLTTWWLVNVLTNGAGTFLIVMGLGIISILFAYREYRTDNTKLEFRNHGYLAGSTMLILGGICLWITLSSEPTEPLLAETIPYPELVWTEHTIEPGHDKWIWTSCAEVVPNEYINRCLVEVMIGQSGREPIDPNRLEVGQKIWLPSLPPEHPGDTIQQFGNSWEEPT